MLYRREVVPSRARSTQLNSSVLYFTDFSTSCSASGLPASGIVVDVLIYWLSAGHCYGGSGTFLRRTIVLLEFVALFAPMKKKRVESLHCCERGWVVSFSTKLGSTRARGLRVMHVLSRVVALTRPTAMFLHTCSGWLFTYVCTRHTPCCLVVVTSPLLNLHRILMSHNISTVLRTKAVTETISMFRVLKNEPCTICFPH